MKGLPLQDTISTKAIIKNLLELYHINRINQHYILGTLKFERSIYLDLRNFKIVVIYIRLSFE